MSREACASAAACPPLREQLLLPTAPTQAVGCQFWSPGEQGRALKLFWDLFPPLIVFIPIFLQHLIDLCCPGAAPPSRSEGSRVVASLSQAGWWHMCPSWGHVSLSCSLPHAINQHLLPLG